MEVETESLKKTQAEIKLEMILTELEQEPQRTSFTNRIQNKRKKPRH